MQLDGQSRLQHYSFYLVFVLQGPLVQNNPKTRLLTIWIKWAAVDFSYVPFLKIYITLKNGVCQRTELSFSFSQSIGYILMPNTKLASLKQTNWYIGICQQLFYSRKFVSTRSLLLLQSIDDIFFGKVKKLRRFPQFYRFFTFIDELSTND